MGLIILRACIVLKQSGCTIAFHQEDNGKPCENAGRKATGLTPDFPGLMAAGLPDDEHIQLKSSSLHRPKQMHPFHTRN